MLDEDRPSTLTHRLDEVREISIGRHLLEDLASIQAKGPLPPSLKALQERLTVNAGKPEAA